MSPPFSRFTTPPRQRPSDTDNTSFLSSSPTLNSVPSQRSGNASLQGQTHHSELRSPTPWKPAKRQQNRSRWSPINRWTVQLRYLFLAASLAIMMLALIKLYTTNSSSKQKSGADRARNMVHVLMPEVSDNDSVSHRKKTDPEKWLQERSSLASGTISQYKGGIFGLHRPKAAIISLVRNEELDGILQSMRQLELHWNRRYHYPWIFFSEMPFSDEFVSATSNATSARTSYELIPRDHWSTPEWIDMNRYMNSLDYLSTISVGKGYMLSYRNMCRWNSGFFYKHPALRSYDYYWRVEPDVHFFCDIPYDPFAFMADNNMVYGFNMNILDDARSFASLWEKTTNFIRDFPHLIHKEADVEWLVDRSNANVYNNCQFFSNFEIGDLNFFRGPANEAYFEYLDRSGGFYYERFGDAPVHTLSVALFAPKDRVWFFRDIGYQHDIARHCPLEGVRSGRCHCEPTGLDENFFKLVPMESPQRKPADTCIRLWLGGEWLDKKEGWGQEVERTLGGDGYGGYVKSEV